MKAKNTVCLMCEANLNREERKKGLCKPCYYDILLGDEIREAQEMNMEMRRFEDVD